MNLFDHFLNALENLYHNKMRAILSTLWVIIWIASVTVMVWIWEWVKQDMIKNFSSWNNVITVTKNYWWGGGWWGWEESQKNTVKKVNEPLSLEWVDFIKKVVPNVSYVLPFTYVTNTYPVIYNWKNKSTSFKWVTFDFFKAKKLKVLKWTVFNKKDQDNYAKYVVLGNSSYNKIFKKTNWIGRKITVWNQIFIVIWVLEKKDNWDIDNQAFMPITTWMKRFWSNNIQSLEILVDKVKYTNVTKMNVLYAFYKFSGVEKPKDVWVRIQTNQDALKQINEMTGTMQMFLIWIASISLLVGWIWVMNIMLVSVTERTREIGIRKSIWASRKDVLLQFLIESIVISILWGLIAILLSYWAGYLVTKLSGWGLPVLISFKVILIASIISIWIWVVFWLFPAWKASRLKPIDALRYE